MCCIYVELGGISYKSLHLFIKGCVHYKMFTKDYNLLKQVLQHLHSNRIINNIHIDASSIRPERVECSKRFILMNDEASIQMLSPDLHAKLVRNNYKHAMIPSTLTTQINWQPDTYFVHTHINVFEVSPIDGIGSCYAFYWPRIYISGCTP